MWLDRYLSGDPRSVWDELVQLGPKVRESGMYQEAEAVARQVMVRVRENIERLVECLTDYGYRFGRSAGGQRIPYYDGPIVKPSVEGNQRIVEFEGLAGTLPMSLAAFWRVVGAVDFSGYHPDWPFYADELIVFPVDTAFEFYASWQEQCEDDGIEIVGPLHIDIAPDHWHKAGVGGAGGYEMQIPNPAADGRVFLSALNRPMFVDYLQNVFRWAGFPGFAATPDSFPRELREIVSCLKEF